MQLQNLELTNKEFKILKRLNQGKTLKTSADSDVSYLYRMDLVKYAKYEADEIGNEIGKGNIIISDNGKRVFENNRAKRKKYAVNEIRLWLSLFIAVLSLLLSIFSILNQYYKWIDAHTEKAETTSESIATANVSQYNR